MVPKKTIIGILGLPLNKQGEFLVTFRQDKRPMTHAKWQVAGGKMEYGESAPQTLIREMREELGVEAKILSNYPIVITQTWEYPNKHVHVVLITYIVDIGNQPITLNSEANQYTWVTSQTLDESNSLPATKPILLEAERIVEDFSLVSQLG